ncbi:butyrophilin subfamily 1 member A1-like [Python bivittatus]|uniref:Butyrophilin subfamily 1 member A1-like n=1 Tax=Python bivittatus TaxID=176946 RepID=A0A9F3QUI7_PYTBI|nr:butyrophilin subfamily 1 member A1-like [Python bivittatus]
MCSFFSTVCITILLQISHVAGRYSIRPPNNPVIGYLEKEVILPCVLETLKPIANASFRIQWILEKSEKIEVKNYNRKHGETQDRRYQGRTELFASEINKGNMSLLLRNISLFDQGLYTCKIYLDDWYYMILVQLVLVANGGDPTITLADYKGQGIGLTCSSEGWYPRPQALWLDSRGENRTEKSAIANTEVVAGIFWVFGSITLEPGVDNEVSCKIINNLVKSERESRILISDAFYPTSSPWIAPFIIILVLFGCLITFLAYKWRRKYYKFVTRRICEIMSTKYFRKCLFFCVCANKCVMWQKNRNALNYILHSYYNFSPESMVALIFFVVETEKCTFQAALADIQEHPERLQHELGLRRIQSHAVAVYLDSDCKHPDITISKDGKTATLNAFGEAKSAVGSLVVVGKEGYVAGKHYWEVKVGKRLDWELGVLTQGERDRTRKGKFSVALGEEHWALKCVRGDLFSSQNEEKIEKKQHVPYSNIGLFLDQESGTIQFYSSTMETVLLITTIVLQSTEKLHPLLSFGECALDSAQGPLEVIHMKIPLPFQKV